MKTKFLNYFAPVLLMGYGVYQVINNGVDITSIIIILAATFSLILAIYSENIKHDEKIK
ncbi:MULTISPECIES: hypothetical protein [Bacillaceae]|uniref:Uncharacterized protein n=1 Tax=Parageobacillus toebii TaxID=153151 RepID=A0A150N1G5_9BACL|nr:MULTISPECIES: hypothetical protein [Bacillaceae]KYD30526.1 hypothetical protein B4110_3694 [Parageobacillus toebii]